MGLIDFSLGDIGNVLTSAREAITGKKIVDPEELAKLDLSLKTLQNKLQTGQIEINKAEAANSNMFVAGWRPFIGWVSGVALALTFIPKALVLTAMWTWQVYILIQGGDTAHITELYKNLPLFPDLGIGDIIALLGSLLGIGGLRTFEKLKKIDTKKVGK